VSCGHDRTCRVWKVQEESHLILRAHHPAIGCCRCGGGARAHAVAQRPLADAHGIPALPHGELAAPTFRRAAPKGGTASRKLVLVPTFRALRRPPPPLLPLRYITGTEWLSGTDDGCLQVWSQMKKKPVSIYRGAHTRGPAAVAAAGAVPAPPAHGSWATAGSEAVAWVQSVAVARGSDLAASGAGDGAVRLWAVEQSKHGGAGALRPLGELPALGFVNGLAVERRGRLVVAALGPEPRLGRWGKVDGARPGLLVHTLDIAPEGDE
jgi:WD40 repeat protein